MGKYEDFCQNGGFIMITENIKNMTDEEVIGLINKIVMEEVEPELSDLKTILAEASGRKLDKSYINIIAERIKAKIQPPKAEPKRKERTEKKESVSDNAKKYTFDDVYKKEDDDEYEDDDDKYPVLSFLSGLYKIFSWILFVGIIVIGGVVSLVMFKDKIFTVCAIMGGSIILSVIFLLFFLGLSEKIRLKLDIERHLRNIMNK